MIEEAIRAILLDGTDNPIVDACGSRIRPVALSQTDVLPFVAYQVTDVENFDTLSGPPSAWARDVVQIDVYAATQREALALSKLIRDRLRAVSNTDVGSIRVALISHQSTQDLTPTPEAGKEKPTPRVSSDFRVLFKEEA